MIKRLFENYAKMIVAHPWIVIMVSILLIAAGFYGITQLSMDPELSMNDEDSEVYKDYEVYLDNFDGGERVFITIVTEDPTSIESLQKMSALEENLVKNEEIISVSSITILLKEAFEAKTGTSAIPPNQTLVDQVLQSLPQDTLKTFVPSEDTALIIVEMDTANSLNIVEDALDDTNFGDETKTNIVGKSVLLNEISDSMQKDMRMLIGLAIVLMIVILGLIFGHVRLRFLPLAMVIVGLILTIGIMGYIQLPVSMVVIAVFPLLIGLGIDHSINFHNRLQEEVDRGDPKKALIGSMKNIGPAMVVALFATILGFITLQLSTMVMLREFGTVVVIGVIMCFIVSMSLLPSVLYLFHMKLNSVKGKKKKERKKPARESLIEKGIVKITTATSKHPVSIISIAFVLAVMGMIGGMYVEVIVSQEELVPQDLNALEELDDLRALIGGTDELIVVVQAPDVTDPAILQWAQQIGMEIQTGWTAITKVNSVANFVSLYSNGTIPQDPNTTMMMVSNIPLNMRSNLINEDRSIMLIRLTLNESDAEKRSDLIEDIQSILNDGPEGVDAFLTGTPVLEDEVMTGMIKDRDLLTAIGVILIFVGLLVLYRKPIKAVIPLVPIILVIGWSLGLMYLLGIPLNPLTIGLGALILGLGAEYTILLMERYYEERKLGEEPSSAIEIASRKIGLAIFSSGLTTMGGFAALLLSSYPFIRNFGMVIVIDVALCLISTIVVLPPLIVAIDKGVISWKNRRDEK
ncbi:MAG: RND family transporter [Thermoplasmata archaeon]|nr:RND family transporter [Thermoplasmata archaeon]